MENTWDSKKNNIQAGAGDGFNENSLYPIIGVFQFQAKKPKHPWVCPTLPKLIAASLTFWLLVKKLRKRMRFEFLLSLTQLSASGGNLFEQLLHSSELGACQISKAKLTPNRKHGFCQSLIAATNVVGKHIKVVQSSRHRSWKINFLFS